MSEIVMPRLSDTMEEGTILRWLKHDGEHVARGEELVEIETDKAAMTYESDSDGTLQTLAREGDTLAVGAPIARVGEASGETVATHNGSPAAQKAPVTPDTSDAQTAATVEPDQLPAADADAGQSPSIESSPPPHSGGRVKASPLARRIAHEAGVDLGALTGSGPGGRIVKADVELAGSSPVAPATPAPAPAPVEPPSLASPSSLSEVELPSVENVASAKGETATVELSRTQRTIARRMAESKATIPDFTLTTDIDMERCVDLRAELKRLSRAGDGRDRAAAADNGQDEAAVPASAGRDKTTPTYNDMIVKACALALRDHPRANGSYRDGRFELHARINVGVAVAAGAEDPTGGALVVPTVFDADMKALGEIARETRTLAERVRDGSITPPELSGGTFTVSNLGMYGVRQFTAIVNPPQAAILAVGAVAPRPIVRKKKLVARQTMSVTLACDHRILYGADAALFLARIRELLEEPAALTL
jgi:pyruvate dehydrogenase E2 component (dihydrolipoamide acetyltransferase)